MPHACQSFADDQSGTKWDQLVLAEFEPLHFLDSHLAKATDAVSKSDREGQVHGESDQHSEARHRSGPQTASDQCSHQILVDRYVATFDGIDDSHQCSALWSGQAGAWSEASLSAFAALPQRVNRCERYQRSEPGNRKLNDLLLDWSCSDHEAGLQILHHVSALADRYANGDSHDHRSRDVSVQQNHHQRD